MPAIVKAVNAMASAQFFLLILDTDEAEFEEFTPAAVDVTSWPDDDADAVVEPPLITIVELETITYPENPSCEGLVVMVETGAVIDNEGCEISAVSVETLSAAAEVVKLLKSLIPVCSRLLPAMIQEGGSSTYVLWAAGVAAVSTSKGIFSMSTGTEEVAQMVCALIDESISNRFKLLGCGKIYWR